MHMPGPSLLNQNPGKPDLTAEAREWLRRRWRAGVPAAEAAQLSEIHPKSALKWYGRFSQDELMSGFVTSSRPSTTTAIATARKDQRHDRTQSYHGGSGTAASRRRDGDRYGMLRRQSPNSRKRRKPTPTSAPPATGPARPSRRSRRFGHHAGRAARQGEGGRLDRVRRL